MWWTVGWVAEICCLDNNVRFCLPLTFMAPVKSPSVPPPPAPTTRPVPPSRVFFVLCPDSLFTSLTSRRPRSSTDTYTWRPHFGKQVGSELAPFGVGDTCESRHLQTFNGPLERQAVKAMPAVGATSKGRCRHNHAASASSRRENLPLASLTLSSPRQFSLLLFPPWFRMALMVNPQFAAAIFPQLRHCSVLPAIPYHIFLVGLVGISLADGRLVSKPRHPRIPTTHRSSRPMLFLWLASRLVVLFFTLVFPFSTATVLYSRLGHQKSAESACDDGTKHRDEWGKQAEGSKC